jgi:hypothetical protein
MEQRTAEAQDDELVVIANRLPVEYVGDFPH